MMVKENEEVILIEAANKKFQRDTQYQNSIRQNAFFVESVFKYTQADEKFMYVSRIQHLVRRGIERSEICTSLPGVIELRHLRIPGVQA